MKPITNILLVLALICYVFLPFYNVSFHGSVTGLVFTAGHITQMSSVKDVLFALVPFITCFAAIGFNCLKNRWWALAAMACIAVCIGFYVVTNHYYEIQLHHEPGIAPDNDLGEGFKIIGIGLGHKLAFVLTVLSLISAAVSLMPFKFNQTLERAVDDTFEEGRRHVRDEWNRLESRHNARKRQHTAAHSQDETPQMKTPQVEEEDKEDPSRFMPK